MENEVIKTQIGKAWLREDSILHFEYKPNSHDTLITAKENLAADKELAQDKKRPLFCDFRNIKSQDKKARDFYASNEAHQIISACALLIDSGFSKIIGNFFMGINKPKTPTRLFTSEKKAIEWLKGFLNEEAE